MFLSVSNTRAGLVGRIALISTNYKTKIIDFDQSVLPIPYYSENVILVDITKHVPTDFDIEYVTFLTRNIPNSTLNILVEDKEMSCIRPLISNKMLFSGDKISFIMKEEPIGASFGIQIRYFEGDTII